MRPDRALAGRWSALAALLAQGSVVLAAAAGGSLPQIRWAAWCAVAALLAAAGALVWWRSALRSRRPALALFIVAQIGLAVLFWTGRPPSAVSVARDAAQGEALVAGAEGARSTVVDLTDLLDEMGRMAERLGPTARPFALAEELAASWRRRGALAASFPLAVTLWEGGERLAWSQGASPLAPPPPAPEGAASWGRIERGQEAWRWRRFHAVRMLDGRSRLLELQLRLAPVGGGAETPEDIAGDGGASGGTFEPPASARLKAGAMTARVVAAPGPARPRAEGNAVLGLRASVDLPLPDPAETGEPLWLRLTLARPSRAAQTYQDAARRLLGLLALWAVAIGALGAAWAGAVGAVVAAWAARALLARAELFRWVHPAFPGGALPASPTAPASLLDPAYFATPALGGLLASTADAVLTAALTAATALLLARWLNGVDGARALAGADAAPPARDAGEAGSSAERRRLGQTVLAAALWGALAAVGLLLLRGLVFTIAENANPRLIGLKAPYRLPSFWALHLVLLLGVGSLLVVLRVAAARLAPAGARRAGTARRGRSVWTAELAGLAGALAGAGIVAIGAPGLGGAARWALAPLTALVWVAARGGARDEGAPRRLALLAPALAAVIWNYLALAEAYGRAEVAWLERKADEIVRPQDDWLQYLLGDALQGMATVEPATAARAAPPSPVAAGLWRNWLAYDLWRRSAVRDMGLPCLVEVLDEDGETASLFASGFLRDFGYEVGARSDWMAPETPGVDADAMAPIWVQTERRRYPTGEERLLRGEIARQRGGGWIRLELPAQSRRIRTLLERLEGEPVLASPDGYLPRAEVDRSLLLLRGDGRGWLDAGPGRFPDGRSDAVVDDLKAGRARWGVVSAGGSPFRCLWREVPPAQASASGEGFLLGLAAPSVGDRLLDLSRLCLLDLLLAGGLAALPLGWRLARRRRPLRLALQERFLTAYLLLGLLPLLLAGVFLDRLTVQGLAAGAREQTRNGLEAALAQLQGLLGEQARALAGSEYIADLLASRLAGQRPLGPFSARQAMVFAGDGRLLLDETLSDLDEDEAARLLAVARAAPLVLTEAGGSLYLGLVIPVDLSAVAPALSAAPAAADSSAPPDATHPVREQDGTFYYRQRVDADLLAGLAEIIQGEVALSVDGETVLASHPERVFSGAAPLLLPPAVVRQLQRYPGSPVLTAAPGARLSSTATAAIPALSLDEGERGLHRRVLPAALSVTFPARERDVARQRESAVLFLAGLATLIFLTAAALGLALAWKIFGPVRVLLTATRRLAGGDFGAPLPEEGRDEIGILSAAFRSMRDDLARAQRELARRERFLATVLEGVPVGVAVFDADGDVAVLNPAAEAILAGFPGGDATGRDDRARGLLAGLRARLPESETGAAELRSADGRRTLRARLAPLPLPDGRADTLLVFEDVTEFLDNKRLALNAELARQVAHEIKNPLTPIQLSIQFLEQAYRDGAPQLDAIVRDTVRQVLEQVSLLRAIATEFSLLGKPGALPVAPVDLPAVALRVTSRYRAGSKGELGGGTAAGGAPRVEIAPGPVPAVLADTDALEKVLGNLMENSLQAMGDPARLALRLDWEVTAREVTLLWADNGPGLPPDVADRLFELYFSTKSQGTGLGLAICRSLLDRMGGRISLSNRPDGSGAVAAVTLPRAPEASPAPDAGAPGRDDDAR